MPWLVFRNDGGLPEYPADHLRIIELRPGEDELEAVQRYLSGDPSLRTYLSLVQTKPASRRFRNQWRHGGGVVQVDLSLARQQRLREIRDERNSRLTASDATRVKLMDQGTQAQIDAYKTYRQSLRDLPTTVQTELAALITADQIEQYQPTWPVEP